MVKKRNEEGEVEVENEYKKGLWTVEEDNILIHYVKSHGKGHWNRIAKKTGLKRCGKSCRLRWMNYLSPNVKRGHFTDQEEDLILRLHKLLGNRWSLIAKRVPGRTDNQVKNYWNTHLSKKFRIQNQRLIRNVNNDKVMMNLVNLSDISEDKSCIGDDQERVQNQELVVVDEEHKNYMMSSSGLIHHGDEFELSTLTYMMDFFDGQYCCY